MAMHLWMLASLLLVQNALGGSAYARTESLFAYIYDTYPDFDPTYKAGSGYAAVVEDLCLRSEEQPLGAQYCNDNDVCDYCAGWLVDEVMIEQTTDYDDYNYLEGAACPSSDGKLLQLSEAGGGVPGFKVKQEWQFFDSEPFFRSSITITRTGRTPKSASVQYASDVDHPGDDDDWFQQDGTSIDNANDDPVTAGAQCMFGGNDAQDVLGVHVFGTGWTKAEVDSDTLRVFWNTPVLGWGESATYVVYTGIGANLAASQAFCSRITALEPVFRNCLADASTTQNFAFPEEESSSEKSLLLLLLLLLLLIPLMCCCCLLLLCCLRRKKKGADTAFATFDAQQMPTACLPAPTYIAVPAACEFAPGPAAPAGPAFGTCY